MADHTDTSAELEAREAETEVAIRKSADGAGLVVAPASGAIHRGFSWELAAQLLAGAAGLGIVLLAMGAAVMWVRLLAAGLPPEEGLSIMSGQALAVAGVHVLIVPVVGCFLGWTAGNYARKVDSYWDAPPEGAGPPPARVRARNWLRGHWLNDASGVTEPGKPKRGLARISEKADSWADEGTLKGKLKVIGVFLLVLPVWVLLVPLSKVLGFLSRHRLMFLWWIVALPFSWLYVSLGVSFSLAWSWAAHAREVGPRLGWSARGIDRRVFAGFAVAAAVTALAAQLDNPPFAPATVTLRSGRVINGRLVASNSDAVYLDRNRDLDEIDQSEVAQVVVGHAKPPQHEPDALIVQLFNAIT